MTYVITSTSDNALLKPGVPLHIKVPGRGIENQPYLGFSNRELAEKFLELKNLSNEDYCVVTIRKGLSAEYQNREVLLFDSEGQIKQMEMDTEGYDYESQIYENAL